MSPLSPLLGVLAFMLVVMSTAWITQKRLSNAGWIDVFWTLGTGLACVAVSFWSAEGGNPLRQLFVAVLAGLWSLRLGLYVALRVTRSKAEDVRYATLRRDWGAAFSGRLFCLALVQAPRAPPHIEPVVWRFYGPRRGCPGLRRIITGARLRKLLRDKDRRARAAKLSQDLDALLPCTCVACGAA